MTPSSKMYRNLRRCGNCGKTADDGVTLLQCKACGMEFYCGKHCQEAAWALHKAKCKENIASKAQLATVPQAAEEFGALRRWMFVHICAFQHLAQQELAVRADPGNGAHVFFWVIVKAQPEETNRAKKFRITKAVPYPIADMGADAVRISTTYESVHACNSQRGQGTYILVVMCDSDFGVVPCILPVAFDLGSSLPYYPPAGLIALINTGEVLL